MSQVIAQPADCCSPCEPVSTTTPGPQGDAGAAGADGTDGISAFTTVANYLPAAQPVMPAEGASITINTTSSTDFLTGGVIPQPVFIQNWGTLLVTAVPSSTSITVQNPENAAGSNYLPNAAPGTSLPAASKVVPGGWQGPAGSLPGGALLAANNLSDLALASLARTNLGLGGLAVLNTVNNGDWSGTDLAVANGGTGASDAATARTNLGLVIDTNVQGYDPFLASIALLGTAADKMIYTTGVAVAAETDFTLLARALAAAVTIADFRMLIGGVKRQYGLLGSINAANLNSGASDLPITIDAGKYRIDKVTLSNATVNLTTATGGVFTAAGGGGTTIAADQALTALNATTKFDDMTLAGITGTDVFTDATLYFRTGTPQGAAATVDVYVFGWALENP